MRRLDAKGMLAVAVAVKKLEDNKGAYPFVADTSMDEAMLHIANKALVGDAFYDHGYLLLVSEVEPWYSAGGKVLQEELVLKVKPEGDLNAVLKFIHELAQHRGCIGSLVGDSFGDRIGPIYERRFDYQKVTTLYFKPTKG